MLYYDPTEIRDNTKLSPRVIEAGQPLVGLETATGADVLVTRHKNLEKHNALHPPGSVLLKAAVKGGFLVQRKSDHDLLHSIREPGLSHILARMCVHVGAYNWLMIVGEFERNKDDRVVLNGHTTGWHWNSFRGAKDAWQLGGGEVAQFPNEDEAADWLLYWNERIGKIDADKEVRPKHDRTHLKLDTRPWRSVLEEFPEVGPTMSAAIADYCGDLHTALQWMSSLSSLGLYGVGVKTKQIWRTFMGLAEGEIMFAFDEDDAVVKAILQKEKDAKEEHEVHGASLPVQGRTEPDPVVG